MDPVTAIERAFAHTHGVIKGASADQLANATPCSQWDLRALLEHTYNVVGGMAAGASGREPAPVQLDEANLSGQFRSLADANVAAWRTPGVLEREINAGAGPMPGAVYASINLLDTLVHSWDIAKATGQDPTLPDDLAAHTLAVSNGVITDEARKFAGFDPAIDVPASASSTDKLVAFLGRKP